MSNLSEQAGTNEVPQTLPTTMPDTSPTTITKVKSRQAGGIISLDSPSPPNPTMPPTNNLHS